MKGKQLAWVANSANQHPWNSPINTLYSTKPQLFVLFCFVLLTFHYDFVLIELTKYNINLITFGQSQASFFPPVPFFSANYIKHHIKQVSKWYQSSQIFTRKQISTLPNVSNYSSSGEEPHLQLRYIPFTIIFLSFPFTDNHLLYFSCMTVWASSFLQGPLLIRLPPLPLLLLHSSSFLHPVSFNDDHAFNA